MWDTTKASVWQAVWQPWGGAQSITGTATLDARFPGQWFQSETGLHYNWHRQYDPTTGRYTQPDPLGFVDGPSLYGYVNGLPSSLTDKDGRAIGVDDVVIGGIIGARIFCSKYPLACAAAVASAAETIKQCVKDFRRWMGPPPANDNCVPPEGTRCYVEDSHQSDGGRLGRIKHYHILEMRRLRSNGQCQWQELRDKIGVGVFPVLDLGGMQPCSAYGASRS